MADPTGPNIDLSGIGSIIGQILNWLGGVAILIAGHFYTRLNRMEDAMEKSNREHRADLAAAVTGNRAAIDAAVVSLRATITDTITAYRSEQDAKTQTVWDSLEAERRSTQAYRETILRDSVTKGDLEIARRDLKDHITSAVRAAVAEGLRSQ